MKGLSQKRNLNKVVKSLTPIQGVKAVILYGSFARGDFGPKSDLDMLIVVDKRAARSRVVETLSELDLDRRIQPTVRTETQLSKTDTGLLRNIFEEGKVVFLRQPMDIPVRTLLALKPYSVFTFELTGLDQKSKSKFNREMYETSKGRYKYSGLLGELGGQKLSRGCVIIPITRRSKLLRFFRGYRIAFDEIRVWK